MHPLLRMTGIGVAFFVTTIGWLIFAGVMDHRTRDQTSALRGRVSDLWGEPQTQNAPVFTLSWERETEEVRTEVVDGVAREIRNKVTRTERRQLSPSSTKITADLDLDQRLKGLMWYSLYNVDFQASWTYTHNDEQEGDLTISFRFPTSDGLYDGFRFVVDGQDRAQELRPVDGQLTYTFPLAQGQQVSLEVGYQSRGMSEWRYRPSDGVANLEDFSLAMSTDFQDIDFPQHTMSPSSRSQQTEGWNLEWSFERIVTGHGIGMVMPVPIQPGELATKLSLSAPISLFFFFLILFVLGTLRGIDIHPINYLFLGGAFFAFHLLFGYSVDHINVVLAFVLSSVVSIVLVVSYLRLVVSSRFAFVESALAQLIYLVGFSLAHFWDGFTGITVTVLSILTLFLLMQLTGRIRWSEVLSGRKAQPHQPVQVHPQPTYTHPGSDAQMEKNE